MLWDDERVKTETRPYNGNSAAILSFVLQYYYHVAKNISINSTYIFCYMQFI